ncbi:hypothetical protein QQ045_022024 [Rhodiola kirilowii]
MGNRGTFLIEIQGLAEDVLVRIKENTEAPTNVNGEYSSEWDSPRSLFLMKLSLNPLMNLPRINNDGDEVVEVERSPKVHHYKHERKWNPIIGQTREAKILCLEGLMDGVLPTEELLDEELLSLTNEHQGHACILVQNSNLEEKQIELLTRHRKIQEGREELKRLLVAGVRDAESSS